MAAGAAALQPPPPPSAEEWQKRGLELHLRNQYEQAIPALTQAVKLNPSLWTSHLFLGICRYRTNGFTEAVASLTRADRLAPSSGQGRDEVDYWLGAARIAAGERLAGLASIERLLARNTRHVEALQLATETYAAASSALWNGVAERHFHTAPGQHIHAAVLESEGDSANALEAYREARRLDPRRPGPAGAMGRLLLAARQPAEALTALEAELALSPRDGEAALYAGLALIQLNRLADAAPRLEAAARAMPRNAEPLIALAQVRLGLGQREQAAAAAAAALQIDPGLTAARELLEAAK